MEPGRSRARADRRRGTAPEAFARFRARDWIGNSRNTADEDVIRTLASMARFTPRITHPADSLDLVQDMITAGLGVGLLPLGHPSPARRPAPAAHQPGHRAAGLRRRLLRPPVLAPVRADDQPPPQAGPTAGSVSWSEWVMG